MKRLRNIRTRLTLWYVGTLAVVLLVYAFAAFLSTWHALSAGADSQRELAELALVLIIGLPVALACAGFGGYLLAKRALAPVILMTDRARTITAEKLSERLPVENPDDEIGSLAIVFNETLSRLDASFDQLKRFTADASHELRTPLTALRSVGEVGLREKRSAAEYREIIGSMLEEVDGLTRLVESLLTLARADAGQVSIKPDTVDTAELLLEAVAYLSALIEDKQQDVQVKAEPGLLLRVDRATVRQAVINLLDNAIKYSPRGSSIQIAATKDGQTAVIEIEDAGPGIDPAHHERIFDRFYRVDKARSREVGGVGLGLSIAKWAVVLNGGSLEVESAAGKGSRFRMRLASVP